MSQSPITCQIIDSFIGMPATGIQVELQAAEGNAFVTKGHSTTGRDGRCNPVQANTIEPGVFKLVLKTEEYYGRTNVESFFPVIEITFKYAVSGSTIHLPILISPYSYTTYRGN